MKAFHESMNIFEMNKDCKTKLIEAVKKANENIFGEKLVLLSHATLAFFYKQKAPYLSAFYRCPIQEDLKENIILPNKDNLVKVTDGNWIKKTNGQLFIEIRCDIKLLPVTVTIPEAPAVEVPTISIVPPTVIDLNHDNDNITIDRASDEWLIKVKSCIAKN